MVVPSVPLTRQASGARPPESCTSWPRAGPTGPETCTSCPCVRSFLEIKLHFFAPSTIFICPSRAWSPAHSGHVNRHLINEQKRLGSVRGGLSTGDRVPRAPGLEAQPGPGSGLGFRLRLSHGAFLRVGLILMCGYFLKGYEQGLSLAL